MYIIVPFHIMAYEGLLDAAFGVAGKTAEEKQQALAELAPKLRSEHNMIWQALGEDTGFTPDTKL